MNSAADFSDCFQEGGALSVIMALDHLGHTILDNGLQFLGGDSSIEYPSKIVFVSASPQHELTASLLGGLFLFLVLIFLSLCIAKISQKTMQGHLLLSASNWLMFGLFALRLWLVSRASWLGLFEPGQVLSGSVLPDKIWSQNVMSLSLRWGFALQLIINTLGFFAAAGTPVQIFFAAGSLLSVSIDATTILRLEHFMIATCAYGYDDSSARVNLIDGFLVSSFAILCACTALQTAITCLVGYREIVYCTWFATSERLEVVRKFEKK